MAAGGHATAASPAPPPRRSPRRKSDGSKHAGGDGQEEGQRDREENSWEKGRNKPASKFAQHSAGTGDGGHVGGRRPSDEVYTGAVLRFPLQTRRSKWGGGRSSSLTSAGGEQLVVPWRCAKRLLASSFLATFSLLVAILQGQHDLSLLAGLVLFCSVSYWSYPTFGTRRNIDIACTTSALAYQTFLRAPELLDHGQHRTFAFYLATMSAAALCYLMARWYGMRRRDYDTSCRFHQGLHALANVANVTLYTALGRIDRLSA